MPIIYLIESVRDYDTVYKIGYTKSNNTKRNRVINLQTGNDGKLTIIDEYHTSYGISLEKALHNFYKPKNIRNEWFELDIKDIAKFKETCKKIENNFQALNDNHFMQKFHNR
jgi:hypothetical protein